MSKKLRRISLLLSFLFLFCDRSKTQQLTLGFDREFVKSDWPNDWTFGFEVGYNWKQLEFYSIYTNNLTEPRNRSHQEIGLGTRLYLTKMNNLFNCYIEIAGLTQLKSNVTDKLNFYSSNNPDYVIRFHKSEFHGTCQLGSSIYFKYLTIYVTVGYALRSYSVFYQNYPQKLNHNTSHNLGASFGIRLFIPTRKKQ